MFICSSFRACPTPEFLLARCRAPTISRRPRAPTAADESSSSHDGAKWVPCRGTAAVSTAMEAEEPNGAIDAAGRAAAVANMLVNNECAMAAAEGPGTDDHIALGPPYSDKYRNSRPDTRARTHPVKDDVAGRQLPPPTPHFPLRQQSVRHQCMILWSRTVVWARGHTNISFSNPRNKGIYEILGKAKWGGLALMLTRTHNTKPKPAADTTSAAAVVVKPQRRHAFAGSRSATSTAAAPFRPPHTSQLAAVAPAHFTHSS